MDLFDVKAPGYASPMNGGEISHLFRAGHIDGRVSCKPAGEATWRTVEELFPGISPRRIPSKRTAQARGETIKASAMGFLILGLLTSSMFRYWVHSGPVMARATSSRIEAGFPPGRALADRSPASRRPLPPITQGIIVAEETRFR